MSLQIGYGVQLGCGEVVEATLSKTKCEFSDATAEVVNASHRRFLDLRASGIPMYGVSTGVGPQVSMNRPPEATDEEAHSLLRHLGAGAGPDADTTLVDCAMRLRLHVLAQGASGISPSALEGYRFFSNSGLIPCVPEIGSVGASGDLVPLAHIALAACGEGFVYMDDKRMKAQSGLSSLGLSPLTLNRRDALSLVNGTSFLNAYAVFALHRMKRLLSIAESFCGCLYACVGAQTEALDPRLHALRGHVDQLRSAEAVLKARGNGEADPQAPLQEIYSLRCAPQALGTARMQIRLAEEILESEINGVSDNPVIVDDPVAALHGGNFQGFQSAAGSDLLLSAALTCAVLMERQLDFLLRGERNLPLLLSAQPGESNALAGAQLTVSALLGEMRSNCNLASCLSHPTNAGNQDIVSMGAHAAQRAWRASTYFSEILAVYGIALRQAAYLKSQPLVELPEVLRSIAPLKTDRCLREEIKNLARDLVE